MWNPINRTRVQVGQNKYRIYEKNGPLFYKTVQGTFDTIDHTFNDTTSSIGDISLMNKGIVSVGKRKGNNPTKVVGIRPDSNQHLGSITTIDPLPHRKKILWNCIDDNYGPHTREELLSGYDNLIDKYITFKEGRSIDVLPFIKNRIHFAFVDGEHNYENIIYETEHISNHQKKGDIIIFDDYNKNQYPGLVEAVDQFCIKKSYSKKIIKGINARDYVVTSKR